jgi:phosphoglycerate dehydrogenase-like enzyme
MTGAKEIKTAFLVRDNCPYLEQIYDPVRRERIRLSGNLLPAILTPTNIGEYRNEAAQIEALITCWGVPLGLLQDEALFPALRVVFFSGGSVKYFARPLLERGVKVIGARQANARVVADFCLGQILLSCKGYFRNAADNRNPDLLAQKKSFVGAGVYGEKVALIGMGAVARTLAVRLNAFDLEVLAVDPFLDAAEADALGVRLVTMEEAFAEAYVVSNHLPDFPYLERVLNRRLFLSMRPHATFINTGRGPQVDEDALVEVFRQRPDLTALLDVTHPEPAPPHSPLYRLPNVQLSSHIAGAVNDELGCLGDFVVEEFERYCQRKTLLHAETLDMLDRLA